MSDGAPDWCVVDVADRWLKGWVRGSNTPTPPPPTTPIPLPPSPLPPMMPFWLPRKMCQAGLLPFEGRVSGKLWEQSSTSFINLQTFCVRPAPALITTAPSSHANFEIQLARMRSKNIGGAFRLKQSLKETGKGHPSDFLPERYQEADGWGKKCHVQWS